MRGTVVSVARQAHGSQLVTAITSGSTALEVLDAGDFPAAGTVTVSGHSLTYTDVLWPEYPEDGVSVPTLKLSGTAGFSAAKWTRVDVPNTVEYVVQVQPQATTGIISATLDHPLIPDSAFTPSAVAAGSLVEYEIRRGKAVVTRLLNREPSLPAALSNLQTQIDTLETTVAGIGGGGSIGFDGGVWGEPYGPHTFDGGEWGDPYG